METPSADASSFLQRSWGGVLVVACGRMVTWSLAPGAECSMSDLQRSLQSLLSMERTFHIYDTYGNPLLSDKELCDTVKKGDIPLLATLTVESLHDMGHCKDELWKLMRDQMTAMLGKLTTCSSQINKLQNQVNDLPKANESAKDENDLAQIVSRQSVKLEFGLEHLDKRFQDLHSMFDKEVLAIEKKLVDQDTKFLEETQKLAELESIERKALDSRHTRSMDGLRENLEGVFRAQLEIILRKVSEFQDVAETAQSKDQLYRTSLNARLAELEKRCSTMETRVVDVATTQITCVEKVLQEMQCVVQKYEPLRVQDILDRVCHLESALKSSQVDANGPMPTGEGQPVESGQGLSEVQAEQLAQIVQKIAEFPAPGGDTQEGENEESFLRLFNPKVVSAIVEEVVGELDKATAAYLEEEEVAPSTATRTPRDQALSQMSTHGGSVTDLSPSSQRTNISPLLRSTVPGRSSVGGNSRAIVATASCLPQDIGQKDATIQSEGMPTPFALEGAQVIVATAVNSLASVHRDPLMGTIGAHREPLMGSIGAPVGSASTLGSASTPLVVAPARPSSPSTTVQKDALIGSRSRHTPIVPERQQSTASNSTAAPKDTFAMGRGAYTPVTPEMRQSKVIKATAVYPNSDVLLRSRGSLSPHAGERRLAINGSTPSFPGGSATVFNHNPPPRTGSTSPSIVRMLQSTKAPSAPMLWPSKTRVLSPHQRARMERSGSPQPRTPASSRERVGVERMRSTSLIAPAPAGAAAETSGLGQTRSCTPHAIIATTSSSAELLRRLRA